MAYTPDKERYQNILTENISRILSKYLNSKQLFWPSSFVHAIGFVYDLKYLVGLDLFDLEDFVLDNFDLFEIKSYIGRITEVATSIKEYRNKREIEHLEGVQLARRN